MGKGSADYLSGLVPEDGWDIVLLFKERYKPFCIYANTIINDMAKAKDIVGTCFMQLVNLKKTFRSQQEAAAYVLVAIRNTAYNEIRREQISQQLKRDLLQLTPDEDDSAQLFKAALLTTLYETIQLLPDQRRQVIQMLIAGKTIKAIAQELSLQEQTVRNVKSQAINQLKRLIEKRAILFLAVVTLLH